MSVHPLPVHPWDAALEDGERRNWLAGHDFGELAANGLPGRGPVIQPLPFAYDAGRNGAVTHQARPGGAARQMPAQQGSAGRGAER